MDTLISVLLYLNVMAPGGNYTTDIIDNYAAIYSAQITTVESNPLLFNAVLLEFEPEAIVITDDLEG